MRQSHDDSRPNSVTKTQHQVSNAERALLVGVGWKRTPRFPGMPAGVQGRESLAELVELARSAGAEIAGTVFQMRDVAAWRQKRRRWRGRSGRRCRTYRRSRTWRKETGD